MIPTGQIAGVSGKPYDFCSPTPFGTSIKLVSGGGAVWYDITYVVHGLDSMKQVARVRDWESGRAFELRSNQPRVQLYTSNWLKDEKGKGGKVYGQYTTLCLETQAFSNAVNHPNFPSEIVRPGQVYKHDMAFKFSSFKAN